MNRFILSLSIMVTTYTGFSQKQYFIYLQSEPEQVFFIKLKEKIHNSTPSGYLILSKLRDTVHVFNVGFPQNKWPEQKFTVELKAKDRGYLLKNFGEKGWGLFDLQTSTIQMGAPASLGSSQKTEQRQVSAFTEILSRAANDPSLKEQPVTASVVVKDNTENGKVTAVMKTDEPSLVTKEETPALKTEDPPVLIQEDKPVIKEDVKPVAVEEYKRSVVTKRSESSTSEGLGLTFIDDYGNGKKDTISIIIPNQKAGFSEVKEPVKEEKTFLEISDVDTIKKVEPASKKNEKEKVAVSSKNNCPSVAGEPDFLKLRKKMAAETSDDGMVDAAKKTFKTKCFTTSQVKNLSSLFLNDSGKYKFFDSAYTYVSDPDNFPSLQAELSDDYYVNRFKAMLR